jgi:hypothetical protein
MIAVEFQGSVVRVKNVSALCAPPRTSVKRGTVRDFSAKSRKRLIDLMARLDLDGVRTVFLTLTFHATTEASECKAAFKRFRMWLHNHQPQASALWRVELQERGTPHYHLIVFNLPYIKQSKLQALWTRCTREDLSIIHIKLLKNKQHAMSYVSKYVAKHDAPAEGESDAEGETSFNHAPYWQGRHWGVVNAEAVPLAARRVAIVDDDELARYFWYYTSTKIKRAGENGRYSQTLYAKDAKEVFEYILKRGAHEVFGNIQDEFEYRGYDRPARIRIETFFAPTHTKHYDPDASYVKYMSDSGASQSYLTYEVAGL